MLSWLTAYPKRYLPGDIIAGVTVATMLVPQSMAYALLAGVPPEVGLYASILPLLIYGLLGSSRILTFGPTAITSVLVLGSISQIAEQDSATYLTLTLTLALLTGLMFLLMAVLRLGFLATLLSQPVLVGYVNAAALIIIVSQIPNLLGFSVSRHPQAYAQVGEIAHNLSATDVATLILSSICVGLLLFFKYQLPQQLAPLGMNHHFKFALSRSGSLVVVFLAIAAVYVFQLDKDVRVVGDIPRGLPPFTLGDYNFAHLDVLLLGAVAIAFVGFMEAISTAQSLVHPQDQTIEPNQELVAMGLANLAAAITGGMPATTSISRSAVNKEAGANTGLSSIIAAGILVVVVVFLTPIFYYLPNAALAAIILVSVINLIDVQSVRQLWRYDRLETLPLIVTVIIVVLFGIVEGILSGVLATIAIYFWQTAHPHIAELGRIEYSEYYRDTSHHATMRLPGILIVRVDESLYFANARYLELQLGKLVAQQSAVDTLILACGAINRIDASALQILAVLIADFEQAGIEIYLAELKEDMLAQLRRVQFIQTVGAERFFASVHDAVKHTKRLPDEHLPIG